MKLRGRLGATAAVLGITVTAAVAATGTAQAAPSGATAAYNGGCGSGYSVIDSKNVVDGTVYLTYNSSNGYNCVVTVSNYPGTSLYMQAALRLSRNDAVWNSSERDDGYYQYYAGPIYKYAPNSCVDWGGSVDSNYLQINYDDHCG
ncbi:hypothetical protein GCM10019016_089480 [Streptomyces prasinosporus]|uniref:Spore-associated protein A n=1 Tax=Streptomyces prasinosporus TaxID=68256 RepID=A0ABP6U5S7_9ACTN